MVHAHVSKAEVPVQLDHLLESACPLVQLGRIEKGLPLPPVFGVLLPSIESLEGGRLKSPFAARSTGAGNSCGGSRDLWLLGKGRLDFVQSEATDVEPQERGDDLKACSEGIWR